MEKVTFFQSIFKILKAVSSIQFFYVYCITMILLLMFMIIFYLKKLKVSKFITIISYCVIIALVPGIYFSFFIDTFDNAIQNFVSTIYFPSSYFYFLIIIITDFLLLKKIINWGDGKWYYIFEIIYFFIIQLLFFIAVRVVISNNVNVFEKTTIYSNSLLTSVVQVTSFVFWTRIVVLIVSLIVNKIFNLSVKPKKAEENVEYVNTQNVYNLSDKDNQNYNQLYTDNLDRRNNIISNTVPSVSQVNNNYIGAFDNSDNTIQENNIFSNSNVNNIKNDAIISNIPVSDSAKNNDYTSSLSNSGNIIQENNIFSNSNVNNIKNNTVVPDIPVIIQNNSNDRVDDLEDDIINVADIDLNNNSEKKFFDDFYE